MLALTGGFTVPLAGASLGGSLLRPFIDSQRQQIDSEEKSQDLPTEVLPPGLLVINDAARGRHHDVAAKEKDGSARD